MTATVDAVEPSVTTLDPRGAVTAVALVLHGGKAQSMAPTDARQLTALRMRPFARSLHHAGSRHGLAVVSLRYRYRGWNGSEMSPVADARWALRGIREKYGDVPVALVGHSMGGRTALRVADDDAVRTVVALAPWVEGGDPVQPVTGRSLLVLHGNLDVVTSAPASRRFTERAAPLARTAARGLVCGDMHAMLFRWRTWHRLSTQWVLADLGFTAPSRSVRRLQEAGARGEFAVPV